MLNTPLCKLPLEPEQPTGRPAGSRTGKCGRHDAVHSAEFCQEH